MENEKPTISDAESFRADLSPEEQAEYRRLKEVLGYTSAKFEFTASPEEKLRLKKQREEFSAASQNEQTQAKERFAELQKKAGEQTSLKSDFLEGK